MKLTKKMANMITSRCKHQVKANILAWEIQAFLDEHGIEIEEPFTASGCGSIVEPHNTAQMIRDAIREAPERKENRRRPE